MPPLVCDVISSSPAGVVFAVSRGAKLVAVEMGFESSRQARLRVTRRFAGASVGQTEAGRQLREYFAGQRRIFEIDVETGGLPPFFSEVLAQCRRIPFGRTVSYGELAAAAGSPLAARAVGQALRRNPAGIVIPCHRVVGANGPGGFSARGGLRTKRALLEFEGVDPAALGAWRS